MKNPRYSSHYSLLRNFNVRSDRTFAHDRSPFDAPSPSKSSSTKKSVKFIKRFVRLEKWRRLSRGRYEGVCRTASNIVANSPSNFLHLSTGVNAFVPFCSTPSSLELFSPQRFRAFDFFHFLLFLLFSSRMATMYLTTYRSFFSPRLI